MPSPKVVSILLSERFKNELEGAPKEVQKATKEALDLLMKNSSASSLRVHTLSGYGKPMLFKLDVFSNKSWQVSFELVGAEADLIRLATHSQMNRRPR